MAGQGDRLERRLRDPSIFNRAPEDHSQRQGRSSGQQASEGFFHRKIPLREWEESEDDDEPEISVKSLTKPIFVGHHTIVEDPREFPIPANTSQDSQHALPNVGTHVTTQSFGTEEGEPAEEGLAFVPFKLVRKYPYLYVGKSNQEQVARFFRENLLENYAWDFFYIENPSSPGDPLLLVPNPQFQDFLKFANKETGRNLSIPRGSARDNFFFIFGDFGTPLPRFLGHVQGKEAYEGLDSKWHHVPNDDLEGLTPYAMEFFKDLMGKATSSFKNKKKSPEAAKEKRIERQKNFGRVTKRVQKYLGLRSPATHPLQPRYAMDNWNSDKLAPYIQGTTVRFVCVDIEAWERNANVITEVGIAVLDSEDIMDVPTGIDGENWFSEIQTTHLRISENSSKVNWKFVKGCPDSFNFGTSEFVSRREIARRIGSIIGDNNSTDKRPVILVGHGLNGDMDYLKKVGYNIWRLSQFFDEVDTQWMYQRLEQSQNGRGLETLCRELHHPGYNFHNAGNDAHYTLQCMIVLAFRQRFGKYDAQPTPSNTEWSDGELDDGGQPQKSKEPVEKPRAEPASRNWEPRW